MALTPFLAEFGQRLGKMFEKSDVKVSTGIDLVVIGQGLGVDAVLIGLMYKAQELI